MEAGLTRHPIVERSTQHLPRMLGTCPPPTTSSDLAGTDGRAPRSTSQPTTHSSLGVWGCGGMGGWGGGEAAFLLRPGSRCCKASLDGSMEPCGM